MDKKKIKQIKEEAIQALSIYKECSFNSKYGDYVYYYLQHGMCHICEQYGCEKLAEVIATYMENDNKNSCLQTMFPTLTDDYNFGYESKIGTKAYLDCIQPRITWLEDVVIACNYLLQNNRQ
jgi:hypothetical protein